MIPRFGEDVQHIIYKLLTSLLATWPWLSYSALVNPSSTPCSQNATIALFLQWVEGANMRHMDCVLWTLFYCALHAPAMAAYASMGKKPLSEKYTSALASIAWRHQVSQCLPTL
jgi:hypothetical protein